MQTRTSTPHTSPNRWHMAVIAAAAFALGTAAGIWTSTVAPHPSDDRRVHAQAADPRQVPARRVHLPFVLKSPLCRVEGTYVDVVLVLDRSTSMRRSIEPGTLSKNDAAIQAAHDFVGLLDLAPDASGRSDQVAVVGFNDTAWTAQPLTDDAAAAGAALDAIAESLSDGTRLDLAFAGAAAALAGAGRRSTNKALIVVLTDGLPNRVPFGPGSPYPGSLRQEDAVLQAAASAKAPGARVYTIGLGSATDISVDLLTSCASDPSYFHHAPRPEDLAAIYGRIATQRRICDPPPTATPVPPTATPTVTPRPSPTACIPSVTHTDVSVVLDLSTSMNRATRSGQTRLDAALAAARQLVGLLRFTPDARGGYDQVAISGFHGEAFTAIGLTRDATAADAALQDLAQRLNRGTRLDLAFVQGQAALDAGPRGIGNTPALVVLTDGQPNGVPADPGLTDAETVLERAARAKAAGTTVFTVGLGDPDEIDRALLQAAASDPSLFFEAPDGDDLAAIYRRIAGRLTGCP